MTVSTVPPLPKQIIIKLHFVAIKQIKQYFSLYIVAGGKYKKYRRIYFNVFLLRCLTHKFIHRHVFHTLQSKRNIDKMFRPSTNQRQNHLGNREASYSVKYLPTKLKEHTLSSSIMVLL